MAAARRSKPSRPRPSRRLLMICYDIADPKRLRRVFKTCRRFADHVQYSIFRAELEAKGRAELKAALDEVIHHDEDQVLIIDLGPARPSAYAAFEALGKPFTHPERHATIV